MRTGLLAAVLLLAGCLGTPPTPSSVVIEEAQAPAPVLIPPAVVPTLVPANPIEPDDEIGFNQSGLRALNVSAARPWTIHEFAQKGRRNEPVFLLVYPTQPPTLHDCRVADDAFRWHSFISDEGNLVGHAFDAGDYTLLLYSQGLENLTLRLGADEQRSFRSLDSYAPAIGLQIIQAQPRVESFAFPFRAGFNLTVEPADTSLFLSEFRLRSNAHSGQEKLASSVADKSGSVCARDEATRDGLTGIAGFNSRFAAVVGAGPNAWAGMFESNASANPRLDATGYLLRFVG
jgi:hypothetical protein